MVGRVSRGSATPHPEEWGPSAPFPSPRKLWDLPLGLVIKLDKRKIFTRSPRPHPGQKFGDTNAEARSFCGSEPSCYSILSVFTDDIPHTLTALFMFRCVHNSFYTQLVHLRCLFSSLHYALALIFLYLFLWVK